MPARTNALREITKFWLQSRHSCLVDESIPVPVPYNQSDIDLVAFRPDLKPLALPNGTVVGPRLVVETKDEHDWEPTGKEFGSLFKRDMELMGELSSIPLRTKGVKFTMLRQEHFDVAERLFGSLDFDRVYIRSHPYSNWG